MCLFGLIFAANNGLWMRAALMQNNKSAVLISYTETDQLWNRRRHSVRSLYMMTVYLFHSNQPTESISVNQILLPTHFQSLYSSEWQLCFSCQDRLDRAPINKHRGRKNGSELPFRRPHRGFQHFPNSKSWVLSACNPQVTWTWPFVWGPERLQLQALRRVQGYEGVSLNHTYWSNCRKTQYRNNKST